MWKWANLVMTTAPREKQFVWLNFDETPLQFQSTPQPGLLAAPANDADEMPRPRRNHVKHSDLRASATHMAITSDDPVIQGALPQIVLMNSRTVNRREMLEISRGVQGTAVDVWRGRTAWANSETMAKWVACIGRALRPYQATRCFALALDACPTHLHQRTLEAMDRWRIAPVFIPANLTGTLQPLDVHVFAGIKREARAAIDAARLATASGHIPQREAISIWLRVIAVRMERAEPAAFTSVGLAGEQRALGKRCKAALQLPADWHPPAADLPSLEELRLLAGTQRHMHLGPLFAQVMRGAALGSGCASLPDTSVARAAAARPPPPTLDARRLPGPPTLAQWRTPVTRSMSLRMRSAAAASAPSRRPPNTL